MRTLLTAWLVLTAPWLFAADYNNIVSLDICSDWMLVHYARREQVGALSPLFHKYPQSAEQANWPVHDGSLERVLSLKPDLVITGEFNAILLRTRLQELGVHVVVTPLPDSLDALKEYEEYFLALLGKDDVRIPDYPARTASSTAPRMLLLNANANATGKAMLENDLLEQAGWQNYITQDGYGKVDMEQLVTDPPDAILWSAPASPARANAFFEHPALQRVMKSKPVVVRELGRWQCAGPWTWQQIDILADLRETWIKK